MPTKKIADLPDMRRCRDPEHNPPGMRVFEPGIYEHTCPRCKQVQTFVVRAKHMAAIRTNETERAMGAAKRKADWAALERKLGIHREPGKRGPVVEAKEAVNRARVFVESDDPRDWAETERQLAIAKHKDPTNEDIAAIADKVHGKRKASGVDPVARYEILKDI